MDPIIRKYTSFDEMKADEYRYWQSRPVHERMDAVEEINLAAYAIKGMEIEQRMRRWLSLVYRSKTSVGRILPTAAVSFALDVSFAASLFFPVFLVLILTRHGNLGLKV